MAWNEEELAALYANVFRRRRECPRCRGALTLELSDQPDELGTLACAACGERALVARRDDPLRGTFRDYPPEENRAIFAAERARRTPTCPVDGTEMDVHLQRSLGLTSNAQITCRRCGRQAVYVRLYE